ncbi:hypothetical protein OKJ48_15065 [Streptomyces kunmingensis]|uniref:Secreted protein n=1 Tax=Streptomyces kunmingensis TaxID=68225 RepID=A0ABU6CA96_9ACTN|nr:hypothetical protein [Streptomyces kunmingensis]MEB3961558.1 hypothetical protein [Streptomyces kunmingensis]
MRTPSLLARRTLTVAASAALPLTLAVPAALAAGVDVTASGSTVTATTTSCPNGGNAALLDSGQADFAAGRQTELRSGTATWQGLRTGTYQTVVVCSDGSTLGPVPVSVSASRSPNPSPTASAPSRPVGGVRGGLGGTVRDSGTLTLTAGGTLVAVALVGGAWYLRRRAGGRRT